MPVKFSSVPEYFSSVEKETREKLEEIRSAIKEAAPQAEEVISYNMPALRHNGILVYYAAAKEHIGFYPTPSAVTAFQGELKDYKTSKGAIQFPLDKPLPVKLIKDIVKFRVEENVAMKGGK